MKYYDFLEPAQIELEKEVKYYNEQRLGLGYEFAREVADTINRILRHPRAWTRLSKQTRRCRTKVFPTGFYKSRRRSDYALLILEENHSSCSDRVKPTEND